MNKFLACIILSFLHLSLLAQSINNVKFEQAGKMINVYYDLTANTNNGFKVSLYLSTNGGSTWAGPLVSIIGAIGDDQVAGKNKKITWNVLAERNKLEGNISFEVRASTGIGTLTDNRNGKAYKLAHIGSQVWMAENLNYNISGSFLNNNGDRLYTWQAAMKACPPGWHLPSDKEWDILVNRFGGATKAGAALKSTSGWYKGGNGSNSSGFNAIPAGYRNTDGTFDSIGNYGNFWSSTGIHAHDSRAWRRNLGYYDSEVDRYDSYKASASSVRCLRD